MDFTPADLIAALGSCPGSAYCGNPTSQFLGQDSNEQFAYVNFFDTTGFFGSATLYNSGGTGFESSNHAVAYLNPATAFGTTLSTTTVQIPEPSGLAALTVGLLALAAVRGLPRRARSTADARRLARPAHLPA